MNWLRAFREIFDIELWTSDREVDGSRLSPTEGSWEGVLVRRWPSSPSGLLMMARQFLSQPPPDLLYLNSAFAPIHSLAPMLLSRLGTRGHVLIAPRGEFSRGALALKSTKKRLTLALSRWAHVDEKVCFQASTVHEANDIRQVLPRAKVHIARDLLDPSLLAKPTRSPKLSGSLDAVFVGRLVPIKNIELAVRALARVKGRVTLRLVGPVEDSGYVRRLQNLAVAEGLSLCLLGVRDEQGVRRELETAHVLVLLSHGENYGHVVPEALAAGCPVLVSDRTPWQHLPILVGRTVGVHDRAAATLAAQQLADLDEQGFATIVDACLAEAEQQFAGNTSLMEHRQMFRKLGIY